MGDLKNLGNSPTKGITLNLLCLFYLLEGITLNISYIVKLKHKIKEV